ncbi:MAG: MaoC family dehydratase N-terminal domain-containing protein [Actinomycetota bacterium]
MSSESTTVEETPAEKAAFLALLQEFVGLEIGEPPPGPDEVNAAMIRHLVESVGDRNPIYTNSELAARSAHGGIVAPPTMLQAWVMVESTDPSAKVTGPTSR